MEYHATTSTTRGVTGGRAWRSRARGRRTFTSSGPSEYEHAARRRARDPSPLQEGRPRTPRGACDERAPPPTRRRARRRRSCKGPFWGGLPQKGGNAHPVSVEEKLLQVRGVACPCATPSRRLRSWSSASRRRPTRRTWRARSPLGDPAPRRRPRRAPVLHALPARPGADRRGPRPLRARRLRLLPEADQVLRAGPVAPGAVAAGRQVYVVPNRLEEPLPRARARTTPRPGPPAPLRPEHVTASSSRRPTAAPRRRRRTTSTAPAAGTACAGAAGTRCRGGAPTAGRPCRGTSSRASSGRCGLARQGALRRLLAGAPAAVRRGGPGDDVRPLPGRRREAGPGLAARSATPSRQRTSAASASPSRT